MVRCRSLGHQLLIHALPCVLATHNSSPKSSASSGRKLSRRIRAVDRQLAVLVLKLLCWRSRSRSDCTSLLLWQEVQSQSPPPQQRQPLAALILRLPESSQWRRLPLAAAAAALSMSPPVVSRWRYRARATAAGPAASSVNGTSRESAPPPRQYDGVDTSEPRAESLSFVPPPSPTSSCRCLPIVFFLDPASLSCIHPGCFVFRESKGGTVRWNTLHQSGQETPDYTKKGWLCCCTVLWMDSFALD